MRVLVAEQHLSMACAQCLSQFGIRGKHEQRSDFMTFKTRMACNLTAKCVQRSGNGGHEHGLAVAAQRILQDARELGVPVRHMAAGTPPGVCERCYDIAQRAQALVDLLALLQALACRCVSATAMLRGCGSHRAGSIGGPWLAPLVRIACLMPALLWQPCMLIAEVLPT